MTTRLDLAIQKHPEHEDAIRQFASRDPSGNLKYLGWEIKVLASGQALVPEIADVVDLFHRFSGERSRGKWINPDIYSYRPHDLACLRNRLMKSKRAQDRKRKKRERLYRIEDSVEASIVFQDESLIVRHIKNKSASAHYGLGTRWCISMLRENYFSDYETQNATFFFVERTTPVRDPYDKVALMISRGATGRIVCFNSLDEQIDVFDLARVHGLRIFEILRTVYMCSETYPGSAYASVFAGTATAEQIVQVAESLARKDVYDVERIIEAICCNDATPESILLGMIERAKKLSAVTWRRRRRFTTLHGRRRRGANNKTGHTRRVLRMVSAALSIHPRVPVEKRAQLTKDLRRRHVDVDSIYVDRGLNGVGISFRMRNERKTRVSYRYRRRERLSEMPARELERRVARCGRQMIRYEKALRKRRAENRKKGRA